MKNSKTLKFIYFEIIYILVSIILIYPTLIFLYNLSIKFAGYNIITKQNFIRYLVHPSTIFLVILILFIQTFFMLIEITGLILIFDKRSENVGFFAILSNALLKTFSYFKKKNIPIFLSLMIILPFFSFAILGNHSYGFFKTVYILLPQTILFKILISILLSFFIIWFIRFVFISHSVILEDESPRDSRTHVKDNFSEILNKILGLNITIILFSIILYLVLILVIVFFIKIISIKNTSLILFLSTMYSVNMAIKYLIGIVFIVFNVQLLTSLFNKYCPSDKEIFFYESKMNNLSFGLNKKILITLFGLFLIITSSFFFHGIKAGIINISNNTGIQVTAHRGSAHNAPENSISAFKIAVDEHADYIELDVQMTKDNELVIFHNFAHNYKFISDMTYEEVLQIKIGSGKYENEKIPTLSEVFEEIGTSIKMNIEIKVPILEENTPYLDTICTLINDLIIEYDMEYNVIISSFNKYSLDYIRKINRDLKIGLITISALPKYDSKKYDFISIMYLGLELDTIKKIHAKGMEVHVWTVNDRETMIELITLGVDNIITDEPLIVKELIYAKKSDFILRNTLAYFFKIDEDLLELISKK